MDENNVEPIEIGQDSELSRLRQDLSAKERELEKCKLELSRASEICQKVIKYNEQLKSLLAKKGQATSPSCHVAVQAVAEEIDIEVSNEDWLVASEKSQMSVTECVRAAAEEATRQAGLVYDSSSGYYYESSSGYYYHPEKGLYYDAKTGVFFYYNQETEKYEFHSKIDVSEVPQNECDLIAEEDENQMLSVDCEAPIEQEESKGDDVRDDQGAGCSRRLSDEPHHERYGETRNGSKRHRRTRSNSDDLEVEDWDREMEEYKNERDKWLTNHSSCRRHEHATTKGSRDRSKEKSTRKEHYRSRRNKRASDRKSQRRTDDDDVVVIDDSLPESLRNRPNANSQSKEEGECSESSESEPFDKNELRESSPDSVHSIRRKRRNRTIDEFEEYVNSVEDFEDEVNKFGDEGSCYSEDPNDCDQSSFPPCIRAIIMETGDALMKCGSLIFITCQGASIGKDKSCDICLSDALISKVHAEIVYAKRNRCYTVKDLGSVNGTFLNDKIISKTNRHAIEHGDVITFGKTKLLLHIHKGTETCDDCEPGQVQAALAAANPEIKEIKILSREDKEKERKRELKQMRKKYGLAEDPYIEKSQLIPANSGYTDRAEVRRVEKGSDNPYEKTETASIDLAISQDNKGFKMLEKMGWSSGQSLGKSIEGIREPVRVEGRLSKAGLGLQDGDTCPRNNRKMNQWLKAQERFRMSKQENQEDEWS